METINDPREENEKQKFKNRNTAGRIMAGFLVIGVGGILLAQKLGVIFPHWVFTWQMLVISIGFFIGFRSMFRNPGWLFPIIIGSVFMLDEFYPGTEMKQYLWPVVIICVGVFMIFKRPFNHRHRWERWQKDYHAKGEMHSRKWSRWHREHHDHDGWRDNSGLGKDKSSDDYIDSNAVFGGIKKVIMSKNFKGGEVNCFMGGTEINLMNADINGRVNLEINAVFGGARLVIPANWELQSEMNAVLGGIEDKRQLNPDIKPDPNKILVLEGNCVFGGIDIRSY